MLPCNGDGYHHTSAFVPTDPRGTQFTQHSPATAHPPTRMPTQPPAHPPPSLVLDECRAATRYRQQVFETLLRSMPPRDAAALLQAKHFLASFGCPA